MKNKFLPLITFILTFISCTSYKMPHIPGVFIADEILIEKINSQENSAKTNYSFTYNYKSCFENYVLNVFVENGNVTNFVLTEFKSKNKENTSEDKWHEYKEIINIQFEYKNQLFINNIFNNFTKIIEDAKNTFAAYPDCYYAKIEFEYSDEIPYILSCKSESLIMKPDIDGGNSSVEITISNFSAE